MATVPAEELTDRLVIATEEQDVLYVLYWLDEMKRMNCLEQAINNKHSWKGYSAVNSIVLASNFSRIRKIILEILLLKGADIDSEDILELAMEMNNVGIVELLLSWEIGGREAAQDAARLIALPLEEAADWIDLNRLLPSDPQVLTGEGPLPLPTSQATASSISSQSDPSGSSASSQPKSFTKSFSLATNKNGDNSVLEAEIAVAMEDVAPETSAQVPPAIPIPSSLPASSPKWKQSFVPASSSQHIIELSTDPRPLRRASSTSIPSTAATTPSPASTYNLPPAPTFRPSVRQVKLHIGRLPLNSDPIDIEELFDNLGVKGRIERCYNKVDYGFAFVNVPIDSTNLCIQRLNCLNFGGSTVTCSLASGQTSIQDELNRSSNASSVAPIRAALPPPRPLIPSRTLPARPSLPSSRALLIVNLPLIETTESRVLLSNFSNFDIFPYPLRDQRVAFLRTSSEAEADCIVMMWNRCIISGRNIRVVHAGNGLFAREAVEQYFRKQDELDRPLGYGDKRRRIG